MRTIIVSSYPNLRLLQLYDQTFSLLASSHSLVSHFLVRTKMFFFFGICFYFMPSCALVQRKRKYIFGDDRKHAINRNNCPKSLRKLFVLIITILCDNRFIWLFFVFSRPSRHLLCHKSDDSWRKFKKSVMMGQTITTWDNSRVGVWKKIRKHFSFPTLRQIPRGMKKKKKICFFCVKKT